jgi:hypothetical protein
MCGWQANEHQNIKIAKFVKSYKFQYGCKYSINVYGQAETAEHT